MQFKSLLLLAAAAVSLGACSQVDDNEIGLIRKYGELQDQPIRGLVYYNPWSTDVITFDNQQTKVEQDVVVNTHDQQRAHVKSVATVQLDRNSAAKMYRNVGPDWVNAIVPQIVKAAQLAEVGQHAAVDMIQQQSTIEQNIKAKLTETLRKRGIILTDYQLTAVKFSDEYMNAVEQKATAVQTAEGEKNKTVAIQERAKQAVITAQGQAEAMKVRAQALEANPKLVDYEAVQKWDGHLPEYMMGGTTPFINLGK